jgi:CRP-like cAMP-binding protein
MRISNSQFLTRGVADVEPLQATSLATKLACLQRLSAEECIAIQTLACRVRKIGVEQVFVHEGTSANHVFLVLEGFAYRYKLLADGRRQILGFLLPGDLSDFDAGNNVRHDHSIAAMQESLVGTVSVADLAALRAKHPNINRACSLASLLERSILRQWVMNVGQRNALQRISHLFCEVSTRLKAVGQQKDDGSITFPVTQAALADTIGLTTVHVNRSLKQLRKDGLIALRSQRLTILDHARLEELAGFDEDYLQLMCYSVHGARARNGVDGADSKCQAL